MRDEDDDNDGIASENATDEEESGSDPNGSILVPEPTGDFISSPAENDVICGRGKSGSHSGNLRFRQIISARKEDYKKAYRRDLKTKIKLEIVNELRQGIAPAR